MIQFTSWLLPTALLYLVIAVATHLVVSLAQTLLHYQLGHHAIGGKLFRNHINFHHTYYSRDHLVSATHLGDEGNNTPYFVIPVLLVGGVAYFVMPFDLFVVHAAACAASFYVHVLFDKEYHVDGSWLQRFAWFRRKQQLHFVHHRHANRNFGVVHFFWDRVLGTYRNSTPALPRSPTGRACTPAPTSPATSETGPGSAATSKAMTDAKRISVHASCLMRTRRSK